MLEILFSWLSPFRFIGIWLDSIAYSLIDNAYELISTFSKGTLIKEEFVVSLMNNLYVIIGIFALFRIALLLVNSIINPDKLSEKGNGLGNIFKNFIVMFVLLVMTPFIFREAINLQTIIVDGNYVQKLFIKGNNLEGKNPGKAMRSIAIGSLITLDETVLQQCESGGTCPKNAQEAIDKYREMESSGFSFPTLSKYIGVSVKDDDTGETVYVYNYMFIVTFAAGIFITWVLLSFGIDIAVRMVELTVLEILAPLFIATYIDPKSAKSGAFHKWLITVGKTYASLFIKLAILSFMLLLISIVGNLDHYGSNLDLSGSGFKKLILLFAILIFAKKAPKWIGDMVGVEGAGLGSLGIGKKLGGAALVGGAIGKGNEAIKKGIGKRAKRIGAGIINRLGADVGGTIAGRSSAKQNALGDKSLRNIRNKEGTRAAFKSIFSKDDRAERNARLREARDNGDIKSGKKQGRLDARVEATQAALNGEIRFAPTLGRGVKQTYDPGYQTRDERRLQKAQNKAMDNQGFDLASINKQKELQEKAQLATRMTGHRHEVGGADGKTIIDTVTGVPATFNGKTLKSNYGSTVTSFEDMAAINLLGKDAFITPKDIVLSDGTKISAGSAVVKNADGTYKTKDVSEVTRETETIKNSYNTYGQKEMEAVFAERKAENANSFVQTQQFINQTQQNIAKFELDLAPLNEQLIKLKKNGESMIEELKSLKDSKNNERDLQRQTELTNKINLLEKEIEENESQQRAVEEKKKPVEEYLDSQNTLIDNLKKQSLLYNNPENPIQIDGVSLNLANEGEFQTRLNKDKEDKRKEADAAKQGFKTSDDKK